MKFGRSIQKSVVNSGAAWRSLPNYRARTLASSAVGRPAVNASSQIILLSLSRAKLPDLSPLETLSLNRGVGVFAWTGSLDAVFLCRN